MTGFNKPQRKRFFLSSNKLGILLLAVTFSISLWQSLTHELEKLDSEVVTIRIAHQLQDGVVEGYEEAIAEYEALHPNVRVKQIVVPGKIWNMWRKVQLVGGNPPDLMEIADYTVTDEDRRNYFYPLSDQVKTPNPYNAGTPLEGTPWKNTFLNGLTGSHQYRPLLMEIFAVPQFSETNRIFCNMRLLREVTGSDHLPETFDQLTELCEQVLSYAKAKNESVFPIAISNEKVDALMKYNFTQQTQSFALSNRMKTLDYRYFTPVRGFLDGDWELDNPQIVQGLQLILHFSRYFQPGFEATDLEDAQFKFLQGQSLMMYSGSLVYGNLLREANFEIGVFPIQLPAPDSRYGKGVLGPISEAENFLSASIGIYKNSPYLDQSLDFLKFITSYSASQRICEKASRSPALVNTPSSESMKQFTPVSEGWIQGFNPAFKWMGIPMLNTSSLFDANKYILFSAAGGVVSFLNETNKKYSQAIVSDIQRETEIRRISFRQDDGQLIALTQLKRDYNYNIMLQQKLETQNLQEVEYLKNLSAVATSRSRN